MLFSVVHDPNITADELNHDLDTISKWAYQWKMSFNPEPSKQAIEVLFSHKKQNVDHPPISFNGSIVPRKDCHKHLGISLDSKLSFKNHINEKINKANKLVGVLRYLSSYIPLNTLIQMYKSFIRPLFDYGDVIYHIPHTQNMFDSSITLNFLMARIEKVQYHASLAMTGCWRGTSQNKLYDELGLESLADRRWARRLIYIF